MSNSTATIEIPRVSAENYAACVRDFLDQPVSPELAAEAVANGKRVGPYTDGDPGGYHYTYTRQDVTEDGEPTQWSVIVPIDGEPWQDLANDMPCSVDWCEGHELERNEWSDLYHRGEDIGVDIGNTSADAAIGYYAGRFQLNVSMRVETDWDPEEIETLAVGFCAYAEMLRSLARRIEKMEPVQ